MSLGTSSYKSSFLPSTLYLEIFTVKMKVLLAILVVCAVAGVSFAATTAATSK